MTVESTNTYAGPFEADGIVTAFPFAFRAMSASEVSVLAQAGGEQVPIGASLYRVDLTAQGGTVLFFEAPAAGLVLYVVNDPDFRQNVSFSNQAAFLPSSHNEANDRAAVRDLYLRAQTQRAVRLPFGEDGIELPPRSARAGRVKVLGTDAEGAVRLLDGSAFAGSPGGNVMSTGPAAAVPLQTIGAGVNQLLVDGYDASGDGGSGLWVKDGLAPPGFAPTRAKTRTADGYVLRIDRSEPVSFGRFGLKYLSSGNQQAALNDMFEIARAEGYRLQGNPHAIYRHEGFVTIDSLAVDGQGMVLRKIDPLHGQVNLTGASPQLRNAVIHSPAAIFGDPDSVGRPGSGDVRGSYGLYIWDATGVVVDQINVIGAAGAGILTQNLDGFDFGTLRVRDTLADAWHLSYGTRNGILRYLIADNNGDDQLALIGYRGEDWVQNIAIMACLLRDGASRAISLQGCRSIWIGWAQAERSRGAGFYCASEDTGNAAATFGWQDIHAHHVALIDCVASLQGYAAFQAFGAAGSQVGVGGPTSNQGLNLTVDHLLVRGAGAQAQQAIRIGAYCSKVKVNAQVYDFDRDLANLGGGDTDLTLDAERIGGNGVVWSGGESGRQRLRGRIADVAKGGATSFNSFIAWNAPPANGVRYDIEADTYTGSQPGVQTFGGTPPQPGSMRALVTRDGQVARRVDPIAEQWTYDGATYLVTATPNDEPQPMRVIVPGGQKLRIVIAPAFRAIVELMAVKSDNQAQELNLVESLRFVYGAPAGGVAGVDYVTIDAGLNQYVVRTRTGPGEGLEGNAALAPITLSYVGGNVLYDISPPAAIDLRLDLNVTRKSM
jgi:hypothetical protein